MARGLGSRTMDGAAVLRCLSVGLSADQLTAVRRAIVPVEVVPFATAAEACTAMSTVLPLVVVVDDATTEADRTALSDVAIACGAELFDVEPAPEGKEFSLRLLDALTRAERRRFKPA
ncbi:MAG: hypothetical protein KIT84_36455 [Labilithrix sp.]|nr:hypothetical protein [Labilithrix sp.]MCW5816548.1 hypothetical protein [Labilithrix sp.]